MPRNDLILRSVRGEPIERFPVWIMRQAGRYMPQYQEIRKKAKDFLSLCKNVDLAVRISLLPLDLLKVDALIIFSDILIPLEALGAKVVFTEGEGPKVLWSGDPSDLKPYDPHQNGFVYEIVRRVKKAQDEVPVIGFAGSPFTLASYMIEGSPIKDLRKTKTFMWEREYDFRRLMEVLTEAVFLYLSHQIEAGADLVQVFDSWTLFIGRSDYEEFVLPYVSDLMDRIKRSYDVPVIYFFRGSSSFLDLVADTKADVLSVDWSVDLSVEMIRFDKVFQGNLDPTLLYAREETIRLKTLELLRTIPRKTGYVFNLGHGIAPDMEFNKVKTLVDTVRGFKLDRS